MPIEVLAKRGADTIRFGPMKPVGLRDPHTGHRPWAVVQLRAEKRVFLLFCHSAWGNQDTNGRADERG